MRKTISLGLLACTLSVFTACSSDNNNEKNSEKQVLTGEKITSFTENGEASTTNIHYDMLGRVVSVTQESTTNDGKKKFFITYKYYEHRIETQTSGSKDASAVFLLKDGRITNSTLTGEESNTAECIYDDNNQLIKVYTKDNSTNIDWKNGNIEEINYSLGYEKHFKQFVYSPRSAKNFIALGELEDCVPAIDGVDPILFMQGYYGKFINNLVEEVYSYNSFSITSTFRNLDAAYTYTLDNKGKVVSVRNNNGNIGNYTWK